MIAELQKPPEIQNTLHPVYQLIRERKAESSKPWYRTDGAKLGMVVEGGAMRAVTPAGFLAELLVMGYRDTIDVVYGESVGSCLGAMFVSGQMNESIKTYWQLVNNSSFISRQRMLRGERVVDIDFFQRQMETHYPYNFAAYQDSGITLKVLAARVDKPKDPNEQYPLAVFSNFEDKNDLWEVARGGIWMPFFCGGPYSYKDMKLWDPGIVDKFPLKTAIEDECTHILAILASPIDYVPPYFSPVEGFFALPYLGLHNLDLARSYLKVRANYRQTMQCIREKQTNQDGLPYVAALALPPGAKRISTFEKREQVLIAMADQARGVVRQTF